MATGSKKINILIGADTRRLSEGLKKSTANMQRFSRRMSLMGTDLMRSVSIPLALAGGALLKFAANLDQSKKALTAVMGSATLAKKHFLELKEAAKAPGLDFQAAIQGSIRFQSMGVSAEKSTKILTAFGKAVALSGGGQDEFSRTIQQVSDMLSRQKVTMEDWRRVVTASPAVMKALAEEFDGMTDAVAIFKEVGFDEFMERLTNRLNATEGVVGSLGNTFNNLWSSTQHLGGEVGLLLNKYSGLEGILQSVIDYFDRLAVKLQKNAKFAEQVGKGIKSIVIGLGVIASVGVGAKAVGALGLLITMFKHLAKAILLTSSAITGLDIGAIGKIFSVGLKGRAFSVGGAAVGGKAAALAIKTAIVGALQSVGLGMAIGAAILGSISLAGKFIAPRVSEKGAAMMAGMGRALAALGFQQGAVWASAFEDSLNERVSKIQISPETKEHLEGLLASVKIAGRGEAGSGFYDLITGKTPKVADTKKKPVDEAFTKIMDNHREAIRKVNAEYNLFGETSDRLDGYLASLKTAIIDLDAAGFGAGQTFKDLNDQFAKMQLEEGLVNRIEQAKKQMEEKMQGVNLASIRGEPALGNIALPIPDIKPLGEGIKPEDREAMIEHLEKVSYMQGVIAKGAESIGEAFSQSFMAVIDGTKKMGDIFKDFFKMLLAKLIKAVIMWAILSAFSGGAVSFGKILGSVFGLASGAFGSDGDGGGTDTATGGMAKSATPINFGEYTNAYNKPEMVGRVDQWAGLISDFMNGHGMSGGGQGQMSPELALRGEDIWRSYKRTDSRMSKLGVSG